MVAYSEVTVELESFLHHSREVSFWEVRTRDFCRDSALSFGNNLKPRGTDESVYPHSRSVGEEGAVLFYSEGHRHGRCFALPAVDVLVQSEMEKNFFPLVKIPSLWGGDFQGMWIYRAMPVFLCFASA